MGLIAPARLHQLSCTAEGEAASVLVGSALNDDDVEFVEHWCVQVGDKGCAG